MKKRVRFDLLPVISFLCLLASLYFKSPVVLILATAITGICLALRFYALAKRKR